MTLVVLAKFALPVLDLFDLAITKAAATERALFDHYLIAALEVPVVVVAGRRRVEQEAPIRVRTVQIVRQRCRDAFNVRPVAPIKLPRTT